LQLAPLFADELHVLKGNLIDRYGPKVMVCGSGFLVAIAASDSVLAHASATGAWVFLGVLNLTTPQSEHLAIVHLDPRVHAGRMRLGQTTKPRLYQFDCPILADDEVKLRIE
jgi:hypothetical protein